MASSKYNAKKTIVDGIKFDSIKESEYYRILKTMVKPKLIEKFELQPRFDYVIQYHANGNTYTKKAFYKADFKVFFEYRTEIWDVKGFCTAIYKKKKKIIEALYDIMIIEKH